MKPDDRTRHKPGRPVRVSIQVLSGLAAMLVTMGVLSITLPPEEVSATGRAVLATGAA